MVGAIGTSLLLMVATLPRTRSGAAEETAVLASAAVRLRPVRDELAALVERDSESYAALLTAFRAPHATEDERSRRHDDIVAAFREARAGDVRALTARGRRLLKRLSRDPARTAAPDRVTRAFVDDWRRVNTITYFGAPGTAELEDIVQKISHAAAGGAAKTGRATGTLDRKAFARRRWVTRPRPGIDRMASAWLIRRFIDPAARFEFADAPGDDTVPFDMFGVEFGHQADACSFEVLAARFAVDDPAAAWIGRIVHDLDLREARYEEPETAGVGTVVEGLRRAHPEDRELLERGIAFIESLAQGFHTRTPPTTARRR